LSFVSRSHPIRAAKIFVAAVALLLLVPAASWAGTVSFGSFSAAPGEINALTVTANSGSVTFTDANNAITVAPAAECVSDSPNSATCTTGFGWFADLDDQNDSLTAVGASGGEISGGTGDDTLVGSNDNVGGEFLSGGDGNDSINSGNAGLNSEGFPSGDFANGGEGNDTVVTGNGNDSASGGGGTDVVAVGAGDDSGYGGDGDGDRIDLGPGDDFGSEGADGNGDAYDGGEGFDTIDFYNSVFDPNVPRDAFMVDLIAGVGNQINNTPSNNAIANFEDVNTSSGADSVTGSDGPNVIRTSLGNDAIDPRGGGDVVNAGFGDDSINSVDGFADRVNCEQGTDTLTADQLDTYIACEAVSITATRPAGADVVPPTCTLKGVKKSYRLKAFRRGMTARVACNEGVAVQARLVGTLKRVKGGRLITARAGDLVLAEKSAVLGAASQSLKLKPSKLTAKLGTRFRLRAVIDARDEFGNRTVITKRVSVKPNKKQGKKGKGKGQKKGKAKRR
jgi:RTX calcium-binding nonapeptide repeat (4 copies)